MFILIAGPYRSGTTGDPDKMAANLRRLEEVSCPLFEAGHVPMIGEWGRIAGLAGRRRRGGRGCTLPPGLPPRCGAPTPGRRRRAALTRRLDGADNDVRIATERGITVYHCLEDVPGCGKGSGA